MTPTGLDGESAARRVGRYRFERRLGGGDHSDVWAAVDERLDRPVAVKVLKGATAGDHVLRERFLREVTAVAHLDHPSIAPVFDGGLLDGELVLVMPRVEGEQLADRLALGPLPSGDAVSVVDQLAAALGAAGDAGLVHADVKPTNVLLSPSAAAGRPFHLTLVDFGISVDAGSDPAVGSTVDYAAPEQLQGGTLDARTDVYGLGCLAFECLTGRPPFSTPGSSPEQVRAAHLRDEAPAPSRQHPSLGTRFDAVLAKALAKDAEQRYPDPAAFAAALAGAARNLERPPPPPRSPPRLVVAGVAVGVLGVAALGLAVLADGEDDPASTTPVTATAPPLTAGPDASGGDTGDPSSGEVEGAYVVSRRGRVAAVGQAEVATALASPQGDASPVVGMVATPSGEGFWIARVDGTVEARGDAQEVGSAAEVAQAVGLATPGPIVAMVARQPGGFWLLDASGGVVPYLGARAPAGPFVLEGETITTAVGNPVGDGFWAIGAIQSVYTIGAGLIADLTSACPGGVEVLAAVPTPTGEGLWLVDAAGQVTACGDAVALDGLPPEVGAQRGVVAAMADPGGRGLWLLDQVERICPIGDVPALPDASFGSGDVAAALVAAT